MARKDYKNKAKLDEDLFGLLSLYKHFNTYIRIVESVEKDLISIQLTDNPGNWNEIDSEKYNEFRMLRRLEIGCNKLLIKYVRPEHLINYMGLVLGIRVPIEKVEIINDLDDKGYYIIEMSLKYKQKILTRINKIIIMKPQKKYEIIEKYLAHIQE